MRGLAGWLDRYGHASTAGHSNGHPVGTVAGTCMGELFQEQDVPQALPPELQVCSQLMTMPKGSAIQTR